MTWTRVDLGRPATWPPGWRRESDGLHEYAEGEPVLEYQRGVREIHEVDFLQQGELWHPLPAPPEEP